MPITRKLLASGDWQVAFDDLGLKVMTLRGLNDFAILHDRNQPKTKIIITYHSFGIRFASPSEAIKHYNAEEQRRRQNAPGAAQPASS